jgi:hypothetical protein
MRLKHLTEDKVNARGAGRREMKTHQPTGGRANEGGLRIGEMERDSLCAHGVSTFLQESMMARGDATDFWICNGCGRIPIYNEAENLFVCPTCDGPLTYIGLDANTMTMQLPTKQARATFSRIAMPYAMKLLDQELTTFMNAGFRFVTETSVARLRETTWDWPTIDIDFEAKERGVAAPEPIDETLLNPKLKRKAAAVAAAPSDKGKGQVEGEGEATVQFSASLQNKYIGFSNMAPAAFRIAGRQLPAPDGTQFPVTDATMWPTVEHYYQAMKFPTEPDWQETIRVAPTATKAKKMGVSRDHALRGDWDQVKERVMKSALLEKFRQNPALLELLQETGAIKLEDVSPGDLYWGGARKKGMNRLGALLEEVRRELKDVRVDEGAILAPPVVMNAGPAEAIQDANATIAAATGGIVRMAPIPEVSKEENSPPASQTGGGQTGGVYLFINSAAATSVEPKARNARNHGSNKRISWDQEGGEEMRTDSGATTEVKVEKLG